MSVGIWILRGCFLTCCSCSCVSGVILLLVFACCGGASLACCCCCCCSLLRAFPLSWCPPAEDGEVPFILSPLPPPLTTEAKDVLMLCKEKRQ